MASGQISCSVLGRERGFGSVFSMVYTLVLESIQPLTHRLPRVPCLMIKKPEPDVANSLLSTAEATNR